jgi:hypothetical protein
MADCAGACKRTRAGLSLALTGGEYMKNGTGNGKVTAEKQHKGKIKDPQKAIAAKAKQLASMLDFSDVTLGDLCLIGHQIKREDGSMAPPLLGESYNILLSQLKDLATGKTSDTSFLENGGYIRLLNSLKFFVGNSMVDMTKAHFELTAEEEQVLQQQACCGKLHFDLNTIDSLKHASPKRFGEAQAFQ